MIKALFLMISCLKPIKKSTILLLTLAYPINSYAFFNFENRSHIQIVGSSTVYPFSSIIAESFGRSTNFKTPVVESTGTGGGIKLFCSGIGFNFPDLVNASRAIKDSEIERCAKNSIKEIFEIKIGYDGIVLANSTKGIKYSLSKKEIFFALAPEIPTRGGELITNPYENWSDINKRLPDVKIRVYGPPATSGTRDAFVELILEEHCYNNQSFIKKYPDSQVRKKQCHMIRNDGKFIEAGENDNLIVQKLIYDHDALGIFGFSFLAENSKTIQAVKINDVNPTFETINQGSYKASRPLYIYLKGEHLQLIAGLKEFAREIISSNTIGKDGYLLQKGLIPLTDLELKEVRDRIAKFIN